MKSFIAVLALKHEFKVYIPVLHHSSWCVKSSVTKVTFHRWVRSPKMVIHLLLAGKDFITSATGEFVACLCILPIK